jgi:hypothetical protein
MTEAATQRQLLAILGPVAGLHVERTNTGVAVDPRTGRHVRFGTPGAPDIRLTVAGLAVAIECKSSTGRQSEQQRRWQAAHEAAGGVYLLCRDAVATAREVARIAAEAGNRAVSVAILRRCEATKKVLH